MVSLMVENLEKRELSSDVKDLILEWAGKGIKQAEIAELVGKTQQCVSYILKTHVPGARSNKSISCGRKNASTPEIDRLIKRLSLENRFNSSNKLRITVEQEHGVKLSCSSVRKRLRSFGLRGCRPRKVPFISERNRVRRLALCKQWIMKPMTFWNTVIWSDETKINYFKSDGNRYVWRFANEEFEDDCTVKTVKGGGGSIMIWACMSANGTGKVVLIPETMTGLSYLRILQENLFESADILGLSTNFIFQQDNDPKHTSKIVGQFFIENNINVLDWPAQSPDLNVIEHLWSIVKSEYHKEPVVQKNQLFAKILEIWNNIPQETTKTLVKSVFRRFEAVINANGRATKY